MPLLSLAIVGFLAILGGPALGQNPAAPPLTIESFAPVRPYCVGSDSVTVVGTVRNTGQAPVAAGAATARIFALAGLDYTEGDTAPQLPALGPGAATTFRWKLQPTGADSPLIASFAVLAPNAPPLARVIAIPHLPAEPPGDSAVAPKEPSVRVTAAVAILENNKIRLRVVATEANVPIILISAHTAGGWRQVGICTPPVEAESAEGGQRPWWEAFKVAETKPVIAKGEASLALAGAIGTRWRATLTLTVRANSAVIDASLQLSPSRPIHLTGIRFCPLLAGAGSFGSAASETLDARPSGPNTVAAVRWGDITCGVLWPGEPPARDWQAAILPNVEGAEYRLFEQEWHGPAADLPAGALITVRARLFALTPSAAASDAMSIALPAAAAVPGH